MKRKALLTMGVLAGISFAAQGWAVPVTYIAEGSLTTQYQGDSNFFPFMPGDKFIFSYSFDDAIDLNNLSGTSEFSPTDLFFRIAGQGYDYSTTNLISGVVAHTENPDSVGMYANSYSVIGGNISLNSAYIIMRDIHNLVLGSPVGVLPITVTKDDFEFSSYQILFSTVVGSETKTLNYSGNASISSFRVVRGNGGDPTSPVPEPTTMLLFGAGLAGLAAVGRRRRL